VGAHDPLHAFAPDPHALAAQLQPHPQRAVGRGEFVGGADLEDLLEQDRVVELAATWCRLPVLPVGPRRLSETFFTSYV